MILRPLRHVHCPFFCPLFHIYTRGPIYLLLLQYHLTNFLLHRLHNIIHTIVTTCLHSILMIFTRAICSAGSSIVIFRHFVFISSTYIAICGLTTFYIGFWLGVTNFFWRRNDFVTNFYLIFSILSSTWKQRHEWWCFKIFKRVKDFGRHQISWLLIEFWHWQSTHTYFL